jgi:hypothetical protein
LLIGIAAGVLVGAVALTVATAGVLAPGLPFHRQSPSTCRLPIWLSRTKTAGFLEYPARTFSAVAVVAPDPESYDAVLGRWLPVPWYDITPNGRSYAYTIPALAIEATSSEVHVAGAGYDRVLWRGQGKAILDGLDSHQVYFTVIGRGSPVTYAVPVEGGRPQPVAGSGILGPDGGFWADDATQDIVRYDAQNGRRTIWWSTSDTSGSIFANLMTFDQWHHPVVLAQTDGTTPQRLLLLSAPHQVTTIATIPDADPWITGAVGDQHGVWLGRDDGSVALWISAHGLAEMLPPLPDGRGNPALILGPCA